MRAPARRLAAVLAAGLLACTTAVVGSVPATAEPDATAQQAAPSAAATRLTASNFRYDLSETPSTMIAALDADLPNVSLATVANDGNRTGRSCTAPVVRRIASFCWNSSDAGTTAWYPQGVTTSSDALGVGMYDGKRILMASWYDHDGGIDKGVRISVVDLTSGTSTPTYRHVLLVEPTGSETSPSFQSVKVHAGGIMWYGNLLYVADTTGGFRVFDLDHLWRVSTGDSSRIGRKADGTFHAFDYKYVLPQTASFLDSEVSDDEDLSHSSVSLDRSSTPDSVIVTEYQSQSSIDDGAQVRTIRVPIDYRDRYLKPASDGIIKATEAYRIDLEGVQGSTAINGKFYFTDSDGMKFDRPARGDLYTWDAPSGSFTQYSNALTVGPEDLSYDPIRDQMWTLGEHPYRRWVYSFDAGGF
ncbi:hypothetical protein [Promicromonospora soli]|uniref:Secreted protein n=1 Tax=Promicromonospora soli TaxID=2035533 RepID=A0A919KW46_9MICO|nr:hypothetical protein [Promicromonospora soli]GHH74006.1 hypothetical protein GCM10017772_26580 [Promicromonospora soli]